jgi:hypothetical protein
MSNVRQDDIDNLLDSWADAKEKIAILEHSIEKYKRLATRILTRNESENIDSDTYTLKRRQFSRQTLGKNDVPKDVWSRYSKTSDCSAFYLTKKI